MPFIVTLGTLGIARGLAKWLARRAEDRRRPPTWLAELAVTKPPTPRGCSFAPGVWMMLALALVMAFVLRRTVFGVHDLRDRIERGDGAPRAASRSRARRSRSTRSPASSRASRASCSTSRLTVGDPTTAVGNELDVIAAVVIGGGSLSGGEGSILGSIVGALVMAFLRNGCKLIGVPNYVQEILIGVIIVVAVALDRWRHTQQGESR